VPTNDNDVFPLLSGDIVPLLQVNETRLTVSGVQAGSPPMSL
jgi:hypothetical protein